MQNGTPLNIPLTVDLHILDFSDGEITVCESCGTNVVYDQYTDGRWYATQRPGINMFENASDSVATARGRGIYYWDAVSDRYIVNAATVYKTSYSGSTMTITTGTQRVYIEEIGDYLVFVDPENDEGWYIAVGTPTTITQIASNFPSTLARGMVELNGKCYVLTPDGDVYESDVEDPTTWGSLNFRNAEREGDGGVYIAKHNEHVAVFGTRSLEFFQDTANATGSTLTPRSDVGYEIGMIDADACCQVGEDLYFVGQDKSNSVGVYRLSSFQVQKVSKPDMDSYLTTSVNQDGYSLVLEGKASGGRHYVVLTMYDTPSDIEPLQTVVYSSLRGWWGFWNAQLTGVSNYPLVSWTSSTGTRSGEGILVNGDLVTMKDNFIPRDTEDAGGVYASGVYASGVYVSGGGTNTNIPVSIITGGTDSGTTRKKRMGDFWIDRDPVSSSEAMTVETSDESNTDYVNVGDIDMSDSEDRLNRMGAYRKRNIRLSGTFSEQLRAEKIQTTVRVG